MLVFSACAASRPAPTWKLGAGLPPAYDEALVDWTRRTEHHDGLQSRVFARATYFSPAFADAYSRYEAVRLELPTAEGERRRAARVADAEREVRVFIALATTDSLWNDLDHSRGSFEVTMVDGDVRVPATRIERLSINETADAKFYFPYLGPLDVGYWVTFPAATAPKHVHMRLAGPPAKIDLVWVSR